MRKVIDVSVYLREEVRRNPISSFVKLTGPEHVQLDSNVWCPSQVPALSPKGLRGVFAAFCRMLGMIIHLLEIWAIYQIILLTEILDNAWLI